MEDKAAKLEKILGLNMVKRVSDMPQHFDVVSSGIMALDLALGIGGFPQDHLSVIYGPEAGGKTTLCDGIAASVIRDGGVPLLIDTEKKGSAAWRAQNIAAYGVDPDELLIIQPETGIIALDKIKKAIGLADLILLDSVYHLITPGEADASKASDQHPAALARLISNNIKSIVKKLHGSGTAMVWTNQISSQFDQYNPETMPGGWRMKFTPIIIVRVNKVKQIKDGSRVTGIWCRANVKKNQAAAPHRRAEFAIYFDRGVDHDFDLWETAKELGIIQRGGGHYSWMKEEEGGFSIQGEENTKAYLKESPETLEAIRLETQETIQELWSSQAAA
jgi:recombination protein RecA